MKADIELKCELSEDWIIDPEIYLCGKYFIDLKYDTENNTIVLKADDGELIVIKGSKESTMRLVTPEELDFDSIYKDLVACVLKEYTNKSCDKSVEKDDVLFTWFELSFYTLSDSLHIHFYSPDIDPKKTVVNVYVLPTPYFDRIHIS